MRAETAAPAAEVAAGFGHVVAGDAERTFFVGDVDEVGHLARRVAGGGIDFVHHHQEVAQLLLSGLKIRHLDPEERKRGMRAHEVGQIDARDLRRHQIVGGRRRLAAQQALAVHDLRYAPRVGAVAEIHPLPVGPG